MNVSDLTSTPHNHSIKNIFNNSYLWVRMDDYYIPLMWSGCVSETHSRHTYPIIIIVHLKLIHDTHTQPLSLCTWESMDTRIKSKDKNNEMKMDRPRYKPQGTVYHNSVTLIGDGSGELITLWLIGCPYWRRAPGIVTTNRWTYFWWRTRRSTTTSLFPDHSEPMNTQRGNKYSHRPPKCINTGVKCVVM